MRLKGPTITPRPATRRDLESRLYDVRGPLVLGVLALLLIILGWWGYRTWQGRREAAAQSLLTLALQATQPLSEAADPEKSSAHPGGELQKAAQILMQIRNDYPSTNAAEQALVHLGNVSYGRGDHAAALAAFQGYLEQYPSGSWVLLAAIGKGYSLEAQQNYQAAAATFQTLAEGSRPSLFIPEALTGLARCLIQLERPREAIDAYQRIIQEYPRSTWAQHAEMAVAALLRQ